MNLGTNYLALAVRDIRTSAAFYEKLGFKPVPNGGSLDEKWMVMANENTKIGLFQAMFPKNMITFNPPNVRGIYRELHDARITFGETSETIHAESGPCHFMIHDPDGNPILFDQHQ